MMPLKVNRDGPGKCRGEDVRTEVEVAGGSGAARPLLALRFRSVVLLTVACAFSKFANAGNLEAIPEAEWGAVRHSWSAWIRSIRTTEAGKRPDVEAFLKSPRRGVVILARRGTAFVSSAMYSSGSNRAEESGPLLPAPYLVELERAVGLRGMHARRTGALKIPLRPSDLDRLEANLRVPDGDRRRSYVIVFDEKGRALWRSSRREGAKIDLAAIRSDAPGMSREGGGLPAVSQQDATHVGVSRSRAPAVAAERSKGEAGAQQPMGIRSLMQDLVRTSTGTRTSLAAWYHATVTRAEPVVVCFWATWCAPCLEERDDVRMLVQRYERTVRFVAVANDEPSKRDAVAQRLREKGITVESLQEEFPALARRVQSKKRDQMPVYPSFAVFDRQGQLIGVVSRAIRDLKAREELEALIDEGSR